MSQALAHRSKQIEILHKNDITHLHGLLKKNSVPAIHRRWFAKSARRRTKWRRKRRRGVSWIWRCRRVTGFKSPVWSRSCAPPSEEPSQSLNFIRIRVSASWLSVLRCLSSISAAGNIHLSTTQLWTPDKNIKEKPKWRKRYRRCIFKYLLAITGFEWCDGYNWFITVWCWLIAGFLDWTLFWPIRDVRYRPLISSATALPAKLKTCRQSPRRSWWRKLLASRQKIRQAAHHPKRRNSKEKSKKKT